MRTAHYWDLFMGRARDLFDLTLAVGAIAGSFALLSPQLLWGKTNAQQMTSAQAVSPQINILNTHKELPLEPIIGIAQFVNTPSDYSIVIDQQEAQITAAELKGDRLEIDYIVKSSTKASASQNTTGKLIGTLNSDGVFTAASQSATSQSGKNSAKAITKTKEPQSAQVSFAFEADGTAKSLENPKATHIFR